MFSKGGGENSPQIKPTRITLFEGNVVQNPFSMTSRDWGSRRGEVLSLVFVDHLPVSHLTRASPPSHESGENEGIGYDHFTEEKK